MSCCDPIELLQGGLTAFGGATISYEDGSQPISGFAVSVPGAELTASGVPVMPLMQAWFAYVAMPKLRVLAAAGHKAYLGAWRDGLNSVLDVSIVVPDKDIALRLGHLWGQRAIYDLTNKATLAVP